MESNEAYRARKLQKQAMYASRREPCVEWIPPLPLASVVLPSPT
jgi:hypothetical protein